MKDNKYSRLQRRGRSGLLLRELVLLLIIAAGPRFRIQKFYSQLSTTVDRFMWAMEDREGVRLIMS